MPVVEASEALTPWVQVGRVQAGRVQTFEGQVPKPRAAPLTPRATLRVSDSPRVTDPPLRRLPCWLHIEIYAAWTLLSWISGSQGRAEHALSGHASGRQYDNGDGAEENMAVLLHHMCRAAHAEELGHSRFGQ